MKTWNNYHTFDFWVFPEKTTLTHNVLCAHCYEVTFVKTAKWKTEIKILEPCQTFEMELLVKILNGFQPLTIFAKPSIFNI